MTGTAQDLRGSARVTRRARDWAQRLVGWVGWAVAAAPLAAQQAPATVVGQLVNRETREPVEGARVAILGLSLAVNTDAAGRFRLDGVAPGVRVVQARAVGYVVASWLLQVDEGRTVRHQFEIEPRIYTLGEVAVTDHADHWRSEAGFEQRRARASGFFLTRADIAARRATSLSELLMGVPGVSTTCRGRTCQVTMLRSPRQCSPEYFLDGHPATLAVGPSFPISMIRGVEIYRSHLEVPVELQRFNLRCGVIAIWTVDPGEELHRPPSRRPPADSQPQPGQR